MALSIPNGGHISAGKKEFSGTAGLVHGLDIEYFVFDKENMNIDVDGTRRSSGQSRLPGRKLKIVMFGGSLFLFPHPVKELADAALEVGATHATTPPTWPALSPAASSRTRSGREPT